MKNLIGALGLSLAFFSATAMAETNSFQALGEMPTAALSTMTDKQLAAVEGTFFDFDICTACVNIAGITQGNISGAGLFVTQGNLAGISQEIN